MCVCVICVCACGLTSQTTVLIGFSIGTQKNTKMIGTVELQRVQLVRLVCMLMCVHAVYIALFPDFHHLKSLIYQRDWRLV